MLNMSVTVQDRHIFRPIFRSLLPFNLYDHLQLFDFFLQDLTQTVRVP